MKKAHIRISAGAVIGLSALYLLLDYRTLAALLIPIAVHELGHLAALRLQRARIREVRLGLSGLCITYTGRTGYGGQFFAALAGPAAGIVFAFAAARLGTEFESGFLCSCAGISAILSAFNLLPALPLDGGRMLSSFFCARLPLDRAEKAAAAAGILTGTLLMTAGLVLICLGKGSGLEIAAVWLMLSQPGDTHLLVKRAGVL